MDKFEQYLKAFYEGNNSYYETALILGEEGEVSLLFPIKRIIEVLDFGQEKKYEEGKDYIITDKGTLKRLKGSSMPYISYNDYYLDKPNCEVVVPVKPSVMENKFFYFSEGSYFLKHQICVTYEHDEIDYGFEPAYQGNRLSGFFEKLRNKEKPTFLFYGDSITEGCNTSGTVFGDNIPPHMDPWPLLVTKELERRYNAKINYINTALGGTTSEWALANIKERVIDHKPDLVLLAFGMNDGSLDLEIYKSRLAEMIRLLEEANPNIEIILMSNTVPNPNSTWYIGQHRFVEKVKELGKDNVAVVDMTSVHLKLLEHKEFKDMTGNNVNHPNDYLIRVHAHIILKVIDKK